MYTELGFICDEFIPLRTAEHTVGKGDKSGAKRRTGKRGTVPFEKHWKDIWQRIVIALACVVVFCTTYALILPAITQERDGFCGLEEYTHTESCYAQVPEAEVLQQICAPEVHIHSDSCLDEEGIVICRQLDYIAHTHNELCSDADGNLHCTLEEWDSHINTDACWQTVKTLVPAEIHSHTGVCSTVQRGELRESEEHHHVDL